MGIFSKTNKSNQKLNVRIPKEPASPEEIDINHGPNWMNAREDLQKEIEKLFPLVLQSEKKIDFDTNIRPTFGALLLKNETPPGGLAYFDEDLYAAYVHDFELFQRWCSKWMIESDTPSTMYYRLSQTNRPVFDLMEKIVEGMCKKRLEDSGFSQGVSVEDNQLVSSRLVRTEEFQDIFRYDVLENLEEIIKLSKMFLEVDVVVPWRFHLSDTLLSRLIANPLISFFDRNFELHDGEFRTFWGLDYSMFIVAFISAWVLSEERISCKVRRENWFSRLNPQFRTGEKPWFIGD